MSATVIVNEQEAVLPLPSVTWKVTVFKPPLKVDPLAKPAERTVVAPVQLSVPTGET